MKYTPVILAILLLTASCSKKMSSNQPEVAQTVFVEEVVQTPTTPSDEVSAETEEEPVFVVVEQAPQFPGGEDSLKVYIDENLDYNGNATGTLFVQFVVEKDGSLTDIQIANKGTKKMEEAALKLVKNMPNWIPGRQRNTKVRCRFVLPIKFEV